MCARWCLCACISETVSCTAVSSQTSVLRASPPPPPLAREEKNISISFSAQALGWEKKKSLSDVAACSHSRYPSSSFSSSSLIPPPPSEPLSPHKHTHTHLSCDPLAAPPLASLIVACVQSGHKPGDQHKRSSAAWLMLLESQREGGRQRGKQKYHSRGDRTKEKTGRVCNCCCFFFFKKGVC